MVSTGNSRSTARLRAIGATTRNATGACQSKADEVVPAVERRAASNVTEARLLVLQELVGG